MLVKIGELITNVAERINQEHQFEADAPDGTFKLNYFCKGMVINRIELSAKS